MKTGRNRLIAEPGLQMSQGARADIEALRASDQLQRIFDSGVRPKAGARPAQAAEAISAGRADGWADGRAEGLAPGRRGLLGARRLRLGVGLVAACIGIVVLADDAVRFPGSATSEALVAAAEVAPATGSPVTAAPAAEPREPAPAMAHDRPDEAPAAPAALAKVSGERIKTMDAAALIRRAVAHATNPIIVEAGTAKPVQPDTMPQASWSARSALNVPVPKPADPARQAGGQDLAAPAARSEAPAGVGLAAADLATSAPAAPEPPQSAQEPVRIVLHYRGAAGEDIAKQLSSALQAQGLADAELRRVPVDVAQANVRFYHDENRPAATQVAGLMRSLGYGSEVLDFTHYSPLPSAGTIEVWLPG